MPSVYCQSILVPHKQLPESRLVLALQLQSVGQADIRPAPVAYPQVKHAARTPGSGWPRGAWHAPLFPPAQLVEMVILLQLQHHLLLFVFVLLEHTS